MTSRIETGYLLLAGAVAILIGLGMVAMPSAFYGSYGIDTSRSVDLVNELRSPGLWFVTVGLVVGLGTLRSEMRQLSLGLSAAFYLSYAAARGISITLDGLPGTGLTLAFASELLIGTAGLVLWRIRSARLA
jgi:hypothetical protein